MSTYKTFVLFMCAASPPGFGQPAQATDEIVGHLIKTGLYMYSGGGANSLLRLSANGSIVVDGKLPGNYSALRAQIGRISDHPVRLLVLTNHQEDRTGTDAEFLADGTAILVQEHAAHNRDRSLPPPIQTYDREFDLKLGGVEARVMHFGSAYTNGDTVVYFPNLKVVAVGDLYMPVPNPDHSAGGSLSGWGRALGELLKLDFDLAVPAHGPPVDRAAVAALQMKIELLLNRATQLVRRGVPGN